MVAGDGALREEGAGAGRQNQSEESRERCSARALGMRAKGQEQIPGCAQDENMKARLLPGRLEQGAQLFSVRFNQAAHELAHGIVPLVLLE